MKTLVTCGPTQEPIDSVRYITNASSGKMGFAVASEAKKRGHEVCLVCGPTPLPPPKGVRVIDVRTAAEMTLATVRELKKGYDVFVCAAAIADYAPSKVTSGKIKSGGQLTITLKPTGKLTKLVRDAFKDLFIVAFKAEYDVSEDALVVAASGKLASEGLNLIVANDIGRNRFGSDSSSVLFIKASGVVGKAAGRKEAVARRLWDLIEASV